MVILGPAFLLRVSILAATIAKLVSQGKVNLVCKGRTWYFPLMGTKMQKSVGIGGQTMAEHQTLAALLLFVSLHVMFFLGRIYERTFNK